MSAEIKQTPDRSTESQIKFYEDHLEHLEKNKDELTYSFYTSEKEAIGRLIQQLKHSI